jgi:hypothetical protein
VSAIDVVAVKAPAIERSQDDPPPATEFLFSKYQTILHWELPKFGLGRLPAQMKKVHPREIGAELAS